MMQRRMMPTQDNIETSSKTKYRGRAKSVVRLFLVAVVVTIGLWEGIKYHIIPDPAVSCGGLSESVLSSDSKRPISVDDAARALVPAPGMAAPTISVDDAAPVPAPGMAAPTKALTGPSLTPLSTFPVAKKVTKKVPIPGQPGRFACPAPSPAVTTLATDKRTPRPTNPILTLSLADAEVRF